MGAIGEFDEVMVAVKVAVPPNLPGAGLAEMAVALLAAVMVVWAERLPLLVS